MPDINPDDEDAVYRPLKFLPCLYVLATISLLWAIYMFCHVIPRMQLGVTKSLVQQPVRLHAQIECGIFNFIAAMVLVCYTRCTLTHPGEIPSDDPKWDYKSTPNPKIDLKEKKKSGDRRHCKWCGKYKPDRAHHCRVCRMCILKMDHHCPWIYNCVGFYNYKYFFLLIMYAAIACIFILFTMQTSVFNAFWENVELLPMFLLVFGETLSFFLTFLLSTFWAFHVWLVSKSMSTIEFCEKNGESPYDVGAMRNFRAVLGSNPILWPLPIWTVQGNGLGYDTEDAPVLRLDSRNGSYQAIDLDATRTVMRRPAHPADLDATRLVRRPGM